MLARAVAVGCAAVCVGIVALCSVDIVLLLIADSELSGTLVHAPAMVLLRAGFCLAAIGYWGVPRPALSRAWGIARHAAAAVLAVSIVAELVSLLPVTLWDLGDVDDVRRRLLRLAFMASRAVPLLALIASSSAAPHDMATTTTRRGLSALLVQCEPYAFAVGVLALPSLLAASALVHKEIAWALPIGSDATILGCVAAAWRARQRGEAARFVAWIVIIASMVLGLGMGGYAFGGPLPTPAALGDYATLTRTLLRDGHILAITVPLVALAWTSRPRQPDARHAEPVVHK